MNIFFLSLSPVFSQWLISNKTRLKSTASVILSCVLGNVTYCTSAHLDYACAISWGLIYDTHRSTFTQGGHRSQLSLSQSQSSTRSHEPTLKVKSHSSCCHKALGSPDTELVMFARIYLLQCFVWSIVFVFLAWWLLASSLQPHLHCTISGMPLCHCCFEGAPRCTYFCAVVRLGNLVN